MSSYEVNTSSETQSPDCVNGEVKLNLGCGGDIKKGYINIDINKRVGVDIAMDLVTQDLPFADNSVDHINLQDIIEHFYHNQQDWFIGQCYRKLKDGGTIYIQTPDLGVICKRYYGMLVNPTPLQHPMSGEQVARSLYANSDSTTPYDNHKWAYDEESLKEILTRHGFIIVSIGSDGGQNLLCQAKK
jgi:predicted SAM-dependent methyltransferase